MASRFFLFFFVLNTVYTRYYFLLNYGHFGTFGYFQLNMLFNWILELWYVVIDIDKKYFVISCDQITFFSIFLGFILNNALFWLWTTSFALCLHCCLIQDHLTSHNLLVVVLQKRHKREICLNFSWSNDVPKY